MSLSLFLSSSPRSVVRIAAASATLAGLVIGPVAAASAHVRVSSDTTAPGSYAVLTFRVPTESATASTTGLRITLPTDHPFTYVATEPVPGWKATVARSPLPEPITVDGTTITEAPSSVTWTADPGTGVAPGQFQQFLVQVGTLPDAGTTVLLPAAQTYSDGLVVTWDQPTPKSGAEPEHPAPALTTTAARTGAVPAAATTSGQSGRPGTSAGPVTSSGGDSGGSGTAGLALGITGTALGATALLVALLRGRRSAGARA